MENTKAIINIITNLQITEEEETGVEKSKSEQFKVVVDFINNLIKNDFNRLLSILYRVDISEEKLKLKLAEHKDRKIPSAEIIANLLIEREEEKIMSRQKYRSQ